jgi:hypothetical protein
MNTTERDSLPDAIRRLAFGVPEPLGSRRVVVALVAYIDESEQGDTLVYAGYFARLGRWEAFTPEWRACLDQEPSIDYLKMNEAMGSRKQWDPSRMDRDTRDARLRRFYNIVTSHIDGGVSVVLPLGLFDRVFASQSDVPLRMRNKFFFMTFNVMHDLLRGCDQLGFDEPISFVFDNQTRGKAQIFAAWESFRNHAPIASHRFGSSPAFDDDTKLPPLQAADMGAWIIRRNAVRILSGLCEETYPWADVPVQHKRITRLWTEGMLTEHLERARRDAA